MRNERNVIETMCIFSLLLFTLWSSSMHILRAFLELATICNVAATFTLQSRYETLEKWCVCHILWMPCVDMFSFCFRISRFVRASHFESECGLDQCAMTLNTEVQLWIYIHKTDVQPSPNGKTTRKLSRKQNENARKKENFIPHQHTPNNRWCRLHSGEGKKNLTFQPDERKLRQTTITLIYMRRDLCKLIIANDLIEHSIFK